MQKHRAPWTSGESTDLQARVARGRTNGDATLTVAITEAIMSSTELVKAPRLGGNKVMSPLVTAEKLTQSARAKAKVKARYATTALNVVILSVTGRADEEMKSRPRGIRCAQAKRR